MALTKHSIAASVQKAFKRSCILQPLEADQKKIRLELGKNILGRSNSTHIKDKKCSKAQLELDVNVDCLVITLKVLGVNPCGVNGLMVMQGTLCELAHGDVVELIYGKYPFEVLLTPSPEEKENGVPNGKMQAFEEEIIDSVEVMGSWDAVENGKVLIYTSAGVKNSEKVAAYDMDGTIIKTKSGNVFPKNCDDWEIISIAVRSKLKRLHQDGFKICFFTNQAGIGKGKVDLNEFKQKTCAIVKKLDIPVQVFIAIDGGYYRKPLPGMWECLEAQKNGAIKINLEKSFYVGDAAGRPESGSGSKKRRKDHSLVDRLFAANVGLQFYTPESHFIGAKTETWNAPDYEPSSVNDKKTLFEPETTKVPADDCEMIIMVGLPGSGKSHFCEKYLRPLGYTIANADTLGSVQACMKECERALKERVSCVVDNTNVDPASRKKFVDLAKKLNVSCRSFVMNATLGHIKHQLAFRTLTDTKHSKINDMVFNMMKKKLEPPKYEEGFNEIARVNIKPDFKNKENERLYKMYLVEK